MERNFRRRWTQRSRSREEKEEEEDGPREVRPTTMNP
jgi:hypothetical protein